MTLTKATYSMINGAVSNILDFGADSTGTNDSTTAIQAAIDYAGTTGGSVYIPTGEYVITDTLDLTNLDHAIQIYGDGDQSRIIATVAFNGAAIEIGNVPQGPNVSLMSVEISSLYFRSDSSTGSGILVNGAARPIISDVFIYGFDTSGYCGLEIVDCYGGNFQNVITQANDIGIKITASQENNFQNVQAFTTKTTGVFITRTLANSGNYNNFYGLWCENNIGQDIVCETSGNLFSGGWCEGSQTTTSVVEIKNNAYDSLTINNVFDNFYLTGGVGSIPLTDSSNAQGVTFKSCWFARSGTHFIKSSSADNFINNRFSSTAEPIVNGGSFSGTPPYQMMFNGTLLEKGITNQGINYKLSSQLANCYATKRANNDTAKVMYVASTGNDSQNAPNSASYPALSLQNLIDLAPDIDTGSVTLVITLVDSMSLNYDLIVPANKNIRIDVGNHTLTFTNDKGIYVYGDLSIVATSSIGSVIANNSRTTHMILVSRFAKLAITNATLTNNSTTATNSCIYVDNGDARLYTTNLNSSTGVIAINNGYIQARNTTGTCTTKAFVADFVGTIDTTGSTVTGGNLTSNGGAVY